MTITTPPTSETATSTRLDSRSGSTVPGSSIARSSSTTSDIDDAVTNAVASVNDPEYPDVSIVDLGLLVDVRVLADIPGSLHGVTAEVDLVPTFTGCPALSMIAEDVVTAVESLEAIDRCVTTWRRDVVWDTDRMTQSATERLAREYTVTLRRKDGTLRCPSCGSDEVADQSMAGPSRCRSVAWCPSCRNAVEVMRG